MNLRDKALQLVNDEMERIESGSTMPDTQEVMGYALILVLADIGEQLDNIDSTLTVIYADGIGVD